MLLYMGKTKTLKKFHTYKCLIYKINCLLLQLGKKKYI